MEKRIYDKKTGIQYELQGDYYLPCLTLPEQPKVEIGIWGKRHLRYIKQHYKIRYTNLLTSCKLTAYLTDIDEQAEEMLFRLVKQLAEKEGVTEQLKAENQILRVARMNNIRNRVTEIVNAELIYN
ncbi:TnpV protein [uncultured Ruminococcus sp.]|uniref:TnpV protein n=1 Tax=uncultured Ruminococcus sp. TaxID=165186 RepID=UPI0025D44664|nr:TnpV protein [uncultured Ruminococcus sp.]